MSHVRSLLFNLTFATWMTVVGLAGMPALLLPRRCGWAIGRFFVRSVMALLRCVVGLEYRVLGAEKLPTGPILVAIKHQSAWDTLILPLLFPDPAVVLKRELLLLPIYGWFAWRLGMIPIDRGGGARALRAMVGRARAALAAGRPVVIFPQGTRTPPGAVRPYQPGVAALYLQTGAPVVPVALNSGLFWPRRAFAKRPGRITLEFLPAIPPGLDRQTFMARLEQAIEGATARLEAEESGDKTPGAIAERRG